ncbi:hypothetical protein C5C13_11775 [Clavibacter michiganensis]|nr:hypothetical protein C5C13_11775 [Clavibacter michiganensis]
MTDASSRSFSVKYRAPALIASVFFVEMGSAILMIGLPLFVLSRYGLALDGAIAIGLRYLPGVFLGPWANFYLRRFSPKIIASVTTAGIAIVAVSITLTSQLWQVQVLSVLLGLLTTVDVPSRLAMRTWVTSPGKEMRINSMIVTVERVAITVGPLMAAGLAVVGGVTGAFYAQALLAIPAILTLLAVPRPPIVDSVASDQGVPDTYRLKQMRALLARFDPLVVAYSITALLYMCGVGVRVIYLPILSDGSSSLLGVFVAAFAVGGIAGGIASTRLRGNRQSAYMVASVLEGACWLVMATGAPLAVQVPVLVLAGVLESAATAVFLTAIQARLRPESIGTYYGWLVPTNDSFIFVGIVIAGMTSGLVIRESALALLLAAFCVLPVLIFTRTFVYPLFVSPKREPGTETGDHA